MYKIHIYGYCACDFDYNLYVKEFHDLCRVLELAQARYGSFEFTVDYYSDVSLPFEERMIMKGWFNK